MMGYVLKAAFALEAKLVFLLPRVKAFLTDANSFHQSASVARDLVQLIVVRIDASGLEAFQKTVQAEMQLVSRLCVR